MTKLQIKRSSIIYKTTELGSAKEIATWRLEEQLQSAADGELLASRYYVNGTDAAGGIKTILGIKATGDNANTIFDVDAIPSGVQAELDKIGYKITKKETANEGMVATYVLEGSKVLEGSVEIDVPKVPVYSMKTVTSGLKANVQTAYQLTKDGANVGDAIEIPKDSSLLGVGLTKGAADNLPTFNADTKTFTEPATGTKNDVLAFAYSVADGDAWTTKVVVIDVTSFLRESEFKDGLEVVDGQVKVKKDADSEDFLSVSASGVKVSGIGTAISGAIQGLGSADATSGEYVTGVGVNASGGLEVTSAKVQASQVAANAISGVEGTDVQAVLASLNTKINNISKAAIGVEAGTGINIADKSGDATKKIISVNIPSTSATASTGKFLTEVTLSGTTLSKKETEVTADIVKVTPIAGKLEAANAQTAFQEVYEDLTKATAIAGNGIELATAASGTTVSVKAANETIAVSAAGVAVNVDGTTLALNTEKKLAVNVIDCGTF